MQTHQSFKGLNINIRKPVLSGTHTRCNPSKDGTVRFQDILQITPKKQFVLRKVMKPDAVQSPGYSNKSNSSALGFTAATMKNKYHDQGEQKANTNANQTMIGDPDLIGIEDQDNVDPFLVHRVTTPDDKQKVIQKLVITASQKIDKPK